jgi:hypothetical protein
MAASRNILDQSRLGDTGSTVIARIEMNARLAGEFPVRSAHYAQVQ